MSEEGPEEDMDKKFQGRMPSAPPKGNGADCKKENGNHASKNGKGGWKKDNGSPRPRSEQNNKRAYSQKPRPMERRPRPRESYNYGQGEEVTEDYRTDTSSVLKLGNKKKNLNHLLNFSVASRDGDTYGDNMGGYIPPRSSYKRGHRKTTVKYNKEQFLQANCQFVVKEGDYTVHSVDPDILVAWDHIEQIRIYGNEVPSCPICLYPPVAAKITRCGHIYCWRCILHYLSLSEKNTWRKCPICYEAVHQSGLKSVKALEMHSYQMGEEITMRLMKREKDSTYAMPVEQWQLRNCKPHSVHDGNVEVTFSKLLVASPNDVQADIIDVERVALETQRAEEGESLEGSYVKAALELLKERQVSVNMAKAARDSIHEKLEVLGQQDSTKPCFTTGLRASGNSFAPLGKDIVEYSSAFSDEETTVMEIDEVPTRSVHAQMRALNLQGVERTISESSDDSCKPAYPPSLALPINTMSMTTADGEKIQVSVDEAAQELQLPSVGDNREFNKRSNYFFYYQASDGQQIYLHSLNARCLVKEYGSLEHCPKTITARIVEMEGISMNDELRGRLKYLNHLPLTCEFKVVELGLKPPVISKETVQHFAGDIEKRKRLRLKKNRDERRVLKKMQQHQNRKYEQCPEMRALMENHNFPEYSSTIVKSEMPSLLGAEQGVPSAISTPELLTPVGSPPSVDVPGSLPDDGGQASMSFAQMLRAGKSKPKTAGWPKISATPTAEKKSPGSDESDNEDRVPVPTYQESFGDAIRAALESYDKQPGTEIAVETCVQSVQAENNNGGKKKKKKTKTLLFTTNMARSK